MRRECKALSYGATEWIDNNHPVEVLSFRRVLDGSSEVLFVGNFSDKRVRVELADIGHFPSLCKMNAVCADIAGKGFLSVMPDRLDLFVRRTGGVFVNEYVNHIVEFAVLEVQDDIIIT
jgi:hypothetical protein